MKNEIDSNFAIAILALVAACVGLSFLVLAESDSMQQSEMHAGKSNEQKVTRHFQLTPCDGLDDLSCSAESVECNTSYRLGDFCRGFVMCGDTDSEPIYREQFAGCKECVDRCDQINNPVDAFDCEVQCREQFLEITPSSESG